MKLIIILSLFATAVFANGVVQDTEEDYESVAVQREEPVSKEMKNPCNTHRCRRGEVCVLDEGSPLCVCVSCEEEGDDGMKVCSTKNVTYDTECHLDKDHCLCKHKQPGCVNPKLEKVRLDYYGACKELTECPKDEFVNFPSRMRDWLYRIMRELANRAELDEYLDLLESAKNDDTHADAVLWKFCDLDIHPEDRHVTRRELMYIIASVKPMEHCLVPFLNKCDSDNDNTISMVEWGTCLGIGHESIQDKCKTVHARRG